MMWMLRMLVEETAVPLEGGHRDSGERDIALCHTHTADTCPPVLRDLRPHLGQPACNVPLWVSCY